MHCSRSYHHPAPEEAYFPPLDNTASDHVAASCLKTSIGNENLSVAPDPARISQLKKVIMQIIGSTVAPQMTYKKERQSVVLPDSTISQENVEKICRTYQYNSWSVIQVSQSGDKNLRLRLDRMTL